MSVLQVETKNFFYQMNVYHDAFFCWSFRKALRGFNRELCTHLTKKSHNNGQHYMMNECTYHGIHNSFFDQINHDRFIRKEWEGPVNCSLSSLLSCR